MNLTTLEYAILTSIVAPITIIIVKYFIDKYKKKPDMITDTLKTSDLIITELDHIKDEFEADRVWISQFHNGGHFYPTGKSIAKFSIVYEVVGVGIDSIQTSYQNIPVSLFSKSINHLINDNNICISDFKDVSIATHGLKYIAEESGCKSSYFFAIKTLSGKFIGILGVNYTKKKSKLSPENIHLLFNHATAIGGVLASHLDS